jgi:hypothetical protein
MSASRPPLGKRLADAKAARDEGMATAEHAADPRIILAIDAAIEKAIASGRRFSANSIREDLPVSHAGLVGARMNSYANRKVDGHPLMKRVGEAPSTLESTHYHPVRVWLGWDAYQALNPNATAATAAS